MALLLRNVNFIVSCDDNDNVYESFDIYCEDGIIKEIGKDLDVAAENVVNCSSMICYPGLINAHHHLIQLFTRNLPKAQGLQLFDWLVYNYEIWKNMNPDNIYFSSKAGIAELAKNGCTTVFDHHYLFPKEYGIEFLDSQFSAASEIGVRMASSRGSMNLSRKDGGLPPDSCVQSTDFILKDTQKAIDKYHDSSFGSMRNVVVSPCSPFTVDSTLYKESVKLARENGVLLHTHLCETLDEEKDTIERFGMRPLEYMQEFDFLGDDVWYAHGIHFNDEELKILRDTNTGVCHCPISNMKLASGVCKIPTMLDYNMRVGIGVDGSASNDGSNLLEEIRVAYLLSRITYKDDAPSPYDFLKMATRGSASLLKRDDIGSIEIGKCADFFLIDKRKIELVAATFDPKSLIATVGYKQAVDMTVVNGKVIVKDGKLVDVDEDLLYEEAQKSCEDLISKA